LGGTAVDRYEPPETARWLTKQSNQQSNEQSNEKHVSTAPQCLACMPVLGKIRFVDVGALPRRHQLAARPGRRCQAARSPLGYGCALRDGRQSSRLTSAAGRAISRVALSAIAHVAAVSRTNRQRTHWNALVAGSNREQPSGRRALGSRSRHKEPRPYALLAALWSITVSPSDAASDHGAAQSPLGVAWVETLRADGDTTRYRTGSIPQW
jgi:hypothetical protein